MFQKKIIALLLCVLTSFSISAQTSADSETSKPAVSPEIKEKSWDLLNNLAREAEQFSLASNRISARVAVANLLWEKDEKTARALFQSSVSDLTLIISQIPPENADSEEEFNTERYLMLYNIGNLRKELLIALAAHDAKLALDTLQFTAVKNAQGINIFEGDDVLEQELAVKISQSDPKLAYEIAKKNLENGFGINALATLESIFKKDAELGAKFAQDILSKIKHRDSNANSTGGNPVSANSNMMPDVKSSSSSSSVNAWEIQSFLEIVKKLNNTAVKNKTKPVLTESEFKETVEILAQKYIKQDYLSAYEAAKIMPELTKFFPALASAIRRTISQQEAASLNNLVRNQNLQNETEGKSTDEILQYIEKTPVADRDDLYYQAAETAFNNGEIEKAKTLHAKVKTKREHDYLDKAISGAMPLMLAAKGDLNQVRQVLSQLKTPEQRIEVLAALAASVAKTGDLKTASALMNEARSVYSGRMKNRRNLNSIFQMAQSYSLIEPAQAFNLLEANTQFFNEIINAAILLDEFNESGAVENDELRLDAVKRASYQNMPKGVELIKNLTAADFERTISLVERFSRPKIRFFARFRIAEALLDPNAGENEKLMQKTLEEQEYEH